MAVFATMTLAEARCKAQIVAHTWVNAHSQRDATGHISVRFQRTMSASHPDYGAWAETTDNATD